MAPDQLNRYRRAVDYDRTGKALARIVASAREAGLEVTGYGALKTVTRGYSNDHPRAELLRFKSLVTWREWPAGAWLATARAKDRIVEVFRLSVPLNKWLRANVGSSTLTTEAGQRA